MSIRIPQKHEFWGDRLLARMGKKRCLILPDTSATEPYGMYMAYWEGFWSALLRPKGAPLPKGGIEADDFLE